MTRDPARRWRLPLPGGGRVAAAHLARRLYQKYLDHGVGSSAATLSFYFFFSLFPFLFVLVTLTAYLPILGAPMQRILDAARDVLPREAMTLVQRHLERGGARPKLLGLGLAATLYSASRGVDAVRAALNLSYDVKESRPYWKTQALALGATIGGAALLLASVGVAVVGGDLGYWLSRHLGIGALYVEAWRWARWPATALLTMFMAALGYYLLPDVEQEFKFITPGSVLGTLAALAASWGFSEYVGRFGSYDVAYGSIGGVIILLTWFYILGLIYIVGGEINATVEHESPEGKSEGARRPGGRPPPKRDRPSAAPVGAAASADSAARSPGRA
ncbi:MAG TPA: YihY/virulence factor BrkB family protein [Polyangia bacterium]|nr:YihY/virulence factor BrkB family protein [Polyangia bacterium]